MAFNFVGGDRSQQYLMPPSVGDWLPEDHLAWFIVEVVGEMDLVPFRSAYRVDGRGGAAFDPELMVALLLYSYAVGERSSRRIERLCIQDVAYRVVAANQQPDHTTIARFRQQHDQRLEALFVESVRLCREAGLGDPSTIAVDGRKVEADAAGAQNRDMDGIEREVKRWLEEAAQVDAAEDALYGAGNRGDELPPELRSRKSRIARIREVKARLDAEREVAEQAVRDRAEREREHEERTGKKLGGRKPKPKDLSKKKVNLTDPDSRILKTHTGFVQGYNSQAAVTADQIVVAAEVVDSAGDQGQLPTMMAAAEETLCHAGDSTPIRQVLADAGYCTEATLSDAEQDRDGPELFVATRGRRNRHGTWRTGDRHSALRRMDRKMRRPRGRRIYKLRGQTVEAVFGQHVSVQRFNRYSRRGLAAANAEWKLVNAAHNLLKLHRHRIATPKLA